MQTCGCTHAQPTSGSGPITEPANAPAPEAETGVAPVPEPAPTTFDPATVVAGLQDVTDRLRRALTAAGIAVPVAPSSPTTPMTPATPTTGAQLVVAGRSTTGATVAAPQARPAGAPTSGIVVADQAETPLVEGALAHLRRSATGQQLLADAQRIGVRVDVLEDAEFEQRGKGEAAAFYANGDDTVYVRASWLRDKPDRAALVVGHELVHAIDDITGLGNGWAQGRLQSLAAAGPLQAGAVDQVGFELSIAKEARAYVLQGQLMRELGQVDPARMGGAVAIAANGTNDRATYDAVFNLLVESVEGGYNPERRQATPFLI